MKTIIIAVMVLIVVPCFADSWDNYKRESDANIRQAQDQAPSGWKNNNQPEQMQIVDQSGRPVDDRRCSSSILHDDSE